MIIAIPMAGLGSRFKDTHKEIKPLIDVNGKPMVKAPSNPEAWLECWYGPGWRTPTACSWRDNPNRCQHNELWR